jgi:hypothetical protein
VGGKGGGDKDGDRQPDEATACWGRRGGGEGERVRGGSLQNSSGAPALPLKEGRISSVNSTISSSGDVWDDREGDRVLRRLKCRACLVVFLSSSLDRDTDRVLFLETGISGTGCAGDLVRHGEVERLVWRLFFRESLSSCRLCLLCWRLSEELALLGDSDRRLLFLCFTSLSRSFDAERD